MKRVGIIILIALSMIVNGQDKSKPKKDTTMKFNELTAFEKYIIEDKGTERPFTGIYYKNNEAGTYLCKKCNAPLYRSTDKFDAHCGWPSFDDEIKGAIKRTTDADGHRTEITCAKCGAHLGHVFVGEGFTPKNIRHCVNSVSLNFLPDKKK
ncbi:MAG: methionine-R-sulfoxide reductase [Prolixibacteraceae bacterium]|nr:methionine-R-sulfoxide reductase [Prolixibacteraceae bacterium]